LARHHRRGPAGIGTCHIAARTVSLANQNRTAFRVAVAPDESQDRS
jgi:hypothetical protein